jgi:hypothetical protein
MQGVKAAAGPRTGGNVVLCVSDATGAPRGAPER